jgi:hypothetical protein
MIGFWITQFFLQNLTQKCDLEVLTVKMYPKKKKKSILGWKYSVSHSLMNSVISYTKRMVPV